MEFAIELAISGLLVIAGVFGLVGSYGLVKLDIPMRRLHAPTKATTVGVGAILIASILYAVAYRETVSAHELLIALFLFLTAPITANFIAKAHIFQEERPKDLPGTKSAYGWALYEAVPEEKKLVDTK